MDLLHFKKNILKLQPEIYSLFYLFLFKGVLGIINTNKHIFSVLLQKTNDTHLFCY